MGKTEVENLDLKRKLNIVSGIIANAKKDLESLKTKSKDVKSDHAMIKKNRNSLNNEFIEYLKGSLKVSLIKIDNDILMTKNEYYVNIKNRCHIINNDMLINKTNCIKLKSVIRENVNSLKNIKNNLYSIKKDTNSLSIDLKIIKEEHINKSNKRVKVHSIIIYNKVNCFNRRFNRFNKRFNLFINKASSKINACTIKDSAIVKNHVDACTSTDDLIVKNHVDACTSTDDLTVKNHVDACASTDDLIVKNLVDACTETDRLNNNEPCDNDNDKRKMQVTINANDENKDVNKEHTTKNKDIIKEHTTKNKDINKEHTTKNKSIKPKKEAINKKNNVVDQVNLIAKIRSDYLKNIHEISEIMNELHDEPQLRHIELNKINVLSEKSLDLVSELCHGGNREWYGVIDNIDTIND